MIVISAYQAEKILSALNKGATKASYGVLNPKGNKYIFILA